MTRFAFTLIYQMLVVLPTPHLYILNVLGSNRLSTKSSAPFAVCSIGSRLQPFNIVRDSSVFVYFFIFSGVRFGLTWNAALSTLSLQTPVSDRHTVTCTSVEPLAIGNGGWSGSALHRTRMPPEECLTYLDSEQRKSIDAKEFETLGSWFGRWWRLPLMRFQFDSRCLVRF